MMSQMSALQSAYREARSALGLYFEPLVWIGRAAQLLKSQAELGSVQDDWRAWLPEQKAELFGFQTEQLETVYSRFSAALSEAFEFRRAGQLARARQAIASTPVLSERLAERLSSILRALVDHAERYGTASNVLPLDPDNFKGSQSQRTARLSMILSNALLTKRSQFLHKVYMLEEMTRDLAKDFRVAAEDLAGSVSMDATADWLVVDAAHYDLNTCLRESIVVLKSFLVALPDEQLGALIDGMERALRHGLDNDAAAHPGQSRWKLVTYDQIVYARRGS